MILGEQAPDLASLPHLNAWYERMMGMPEVQKVKTDRDVAFAEAIKAMNTADAGKK